MLRDVLEATALDGLQHHLMDPHLVERFCEHYARHAIKAAPEHNADRTSDIVELQKIERDMERLVQAILDGVRRSKVPRVLISSNRTRIGDINSEHFSLQ